MALKEIKVGSCRFTIQGHCVTAGICFSLSSIVVLKTANGTKSRLILPWFP
jgi:hypothetical protein